MACAPLRKLILKRTRKPWICTRPALLAALVRQPIMVDTARHQTRLRERRDGVLIDLARARVILPQEARQAMARPIGVTLVTRRCAE